MSKNPTLFIDIDGLLIRHSGHGASKQWYEDEPLVDGAKRLLDELERRGCCVVLVTARKECARQATVAQLAKHGLHYDQLVMGVTSGLRVVLNDSKEHAVFCSVCGKEVKGKAVACCENGVTLVPEDSCLAITLLRNLPIDVESILGRLA